jgi:hypothetical protein
MGYQEEYYQKRRDDILKMRALRYASDPAYRERIIERARLSNMNSRAVPREITTMVTFDGKREKFYRIMELPPLLKRSYSVLRQWLLSGVMPRPCCRDGAGKAVFSQSQTYLLQYIVSNVDGGILCVTYPEMKMILRKFWRKRYSKSTVLKELVRLRNANQRGTSIRSSSIPAEKQQGRKALRSKRVPKDRVSRAGEGKGVTRYGRKVRREDKGVKA